ncbi:MAG: anion transporter [Alphaproteobacteria bacterium]|nr:anion transporter [Alphaproteobacteria bacterium]
METLVVAVFAAVYLGMALGRWPGTRIDRTGVALIGAIALATVGAVDAELLRRTVDLPTLAILFALMVLSSQVTASGFFERVSAAIAASTAAPPVILALVIAVAGLLAAVLTNDVVVWAMTPVLVRGLRERGLDPRPFVIALAAAANAGSAATVIGNPQNLLIGETASLAFWPFLAICGVPAAAAMAIVFLVVFWQCRRWPAQGPAPARLAARPAIDRGMLAKGVLAALAIIVVFSLPVERWVWSLGVAGLLLLSRQLSTRQMLSMVDWHLLLLFASLFVVTGALAGTGAIAATLASLRQWNLDLAAMPVLAAAALLGSNTIGNVPLVTLLLALDLGLGAKQLPALALFSTLAGNLLIVGSIANIIAVERAAAEGVRIGFIDYARIGVPATLLSLTFAYVWLVSILG